MENKNYTLIADVTNYCEKFGVVELTEERALSIIGDMHILVPSNKVSVLSNYRLQVSHDSEALIDFIKSGLLELGYCHSEPIVTVESTKSEPTSTYSIEIEDSNTIKTILGTQDLVIGSLEIDTILEEISNLAQVPLPSKAEYFGDSYDGELSLTYQDVTEEVARTIFNNIWRSSSVDTKVLLVDRTPKDGYNAVTKGCEYGAKRYMYLA